MNEIEEIQNVNEIEEKKQNVNENREKKHNMNEKKKQNNKRALAIPKSTRE